MFSKLLSVAALVGIASARFQVDTTTETEMWGFNTDVRTQGNAEPESRES